MASKKTKAAPPSDDIDDLFDGFDDKPAPPKPAAAAAADKKKQPPSKAALDQDILAELEKDLEKPSRPHTPRVRDATAPPAAVKGSPGRLGTPTGDDKPVPRKSTDSAHSLRASFTPSAASSDVPEKQPAAAEQQQQQGGGWWGSVFSTASAAMKQAEAAVKEIRENEEARKWAEQVRGNVGGLKALGDNLRQQALPTFTNILHTLAPPISQHERLLIHITHDMVGYPSLDPIIHEVFSRVMAQVEGGDLMVIQRGQESTSRHAADASSGWRDGPWWRQTEPARDLGLIKGLVEGTKLCRAAADGYAEEYFAAHGGIGEAKIRATESLSESNPVRSSDLFLAVQAITVDADKDLFVRAAAAPSAVKEAEADAPADELVCFAILVLDPVHEIEYSAVSQSIPAQWVRWLDASNPLTPVSADEPSQQQPASIPDEIQEIIDNGGVDPREWAAEWIEETLGLAIGGVAQRYVSRRMGVSDGGIGRGKRRVEELVQDNAGEAARAGLI
ncbi:maintenance of telomere capping protein 1 [Plectosphaerella plurivora]|uniref:Maintenance of telomere capping protein 1 n=1 Tax=Plectosphaerella plurivora TaxID=936078 RepID=A0A9P8V425_9PEZI|nr:maintenance of telomere capping protein 1 [Plectosphaerella plurivora]